MGDVGTRSVFAGVAGASKIAKLNLESLAAVGGSPPAVSDAVDFAMAQAPPEAQAAYRAGLAALRGDAVAIAVAAHAPPEVVTLIEAISSIPAVKVGLASVTDLVASAIGDATTEITDAAFTAAAGAVAEAVGSSIPLIAAAVQMYGNVESHIRSVRDTRIQQACDIARRDQFSPLPGTGYGGAVAPCDYPRGLLDMTQALIMDPADAWNYLFVGLDKRCGGDHSALPLTDAILNANIAYVDSAAKKCGFMASRKMRYAKQLGAGACSAAALNAQKFVLEADRLLKAARACRGVRGSDGGALFLSAAIAAIAEARRRHSTDIWDLRLRLASLYVVGPDAGAGPGARWGRALICDVLRNQRLARRPLYSLTSREGDRGH